MMKRVLYIICMLLANVSIVAHAVVPHHHRCEMLNAVVNLLNEEACAHHHDLTDLPFHHHSDEPGECLIDDNYTAPRVQNEGSNLVPDSVEHETESPFSIDIADRSYVVRFYPQHQVLRYKPYRSDSFPDYVAASLGLRAPPRD